MRRSVPHDGFYFADRDRTVLAQGANAPRRILFGPDRSKAPETSLEVLDADDRIAPA